MKQYMLDRWKARKQRGIAQLGGKCVSCGGTDDLQFDHIDPSTKSFTIGRNTSCSDEKFTNELKKCQLLCKACHKIKTTENGDLDNRPANIKCNCGRLCSSIREYAGHKRWCKK